jgi:cytochrome c oxidase cbb3-type subunit III
MRASLFDRRCRLAFSALGAAFGVLGLAACDEVPATGKAATAEAAQPGAAPEEEYGEFLARPGELANVETNDILKSLRRTATAKNFGQEVYNRSCSSCHGADLKGSREHATPDLTDTQWRFAGDDAETGGAVMYPSDIEWTVRYGIRAADENSRGREADMVAFDPQFRTEEDTREYGGGRFLTDDEIADVVEYVLKISGQDSDGAKATRGEGLFHDGDKGNCYDCHENNGVGNRAIGSTNLTDRSEYLWGSDRASILESIVHGRRGVMPAFEGQLKPEEIKAVSIYLYYRALPPQ